MGFLTEDLVASVRNRSFMPISQSTFQEADVITILNEELLLKLVSDIMGAREDFFLATKESAIVANKDHYLLPKRCIGNTIKALFPQDSGGSRGAPLPRIDVDQSDEMVGQSGSPQKFYFEADEVVVVPKPSMAEGSLLFSYFRKPNQLVATSSCAKVTSLVSNTTHTTFTVNTDLSASLVVGSTIDILRATSPYTLWAEEVAITSISATQIQVLKTAVQDVDGTVEPQVNDYICPSGYSNIPMIPEEFHPVLAQMATCRVLSALGHLDKLQAAKMELQELRGEALKLIRNRADSSPKKVKPQTSLLNAFRG